MAARSALAELAERLPPDQGIAAASALARINAVAPPLPPADHLAPGVEVSLAYAQRALEAAASVAADAGEGLRIAQAAERLAMPVWG